MAGLLPAAPTWTPVLGNCPFDRCFPGAFPLLLLTYFSVHATSGSAEVKAL